MANIITASRMAAAPLIIITDTFSPAFYALFFYCGISDMLDGPIARKTGSESRFGEGLDSAADLIFIGICLYKILPELGIPRWLWIWIAVVAAIKVVNLICGYVCRHEPVFLHTMANRITGFMLFTAAFLVEIIPIEQIGAVLCVTATFAAVQEGHYIRTGKKQRIWYIKNESKSGREHHDRI
ncbi:MAG: CDP-alcohol phosphatidyltransferase family protein [Anaerovoracaceae bacterium]